MPRDLPEFDRLLSIMARLRDPERGCAWDLAQDFVSIAPYTIEEAYEVADAIDRGDTADLKEELGDLLLQVVFHAQMAKEAGLFAFEDVAQSIADKMERRHPHIFAAHEGSPNAALGVWESIKAAERKDKSLAGALDGVALGLPGLLRAEKLQKRAARVGFDWPDAGGAAQKLHEEIAEFDEAIDERHRFEEAGDLLFSAVNWLRKQGIAPEDAIRAANAKFERRFRAMEAKARKKGIVFDALRLEDQERLWQEVKREES